MLKFNFDTFSFLGKSFLNPITLIDYQINNIFDTDDKKKELLNYIDDKKFIENLQTYGQALGGVWFDLWQKIAIVATQEEHKNKSLWGKITWVVETEWAELQNQWRTGFKNLILYSFNLILDILKIILSNPTILIISTTVFIYFFYK